MSEYRIIEWMLSYWINLDVYKRPDMKYTRNFVSLWKPIVFTLLFILSEIECNLVSGVVGVNRPIEKCKQARDIYGDKHVGGSKRGIYWRAFDVK